MMLNCLLKVSHDQAGSRIIDEDDESDDKKKGDTVYVPNDEAEEEPSTPACRHHEPLDGREGTTAAPVHLLHARGGEGKACITIDLVPDVALAMVVELLGTPWPKDESSQPEHITFYFLCDVTSMAQVCKRWKVLVRSSGIWRSICEWKWPWMVAAGEGGSGMIELLSSTDPLYRCIKDDDGSTSLYMDLCSSLGRCQWEAGVCKEGAWTIFPDHYEMIVDVYEAQTGKCLLTKFGSFDITWGHHGDAAEHEYQEYWMLDSNDLFTDERGQPQPEKRFCWPPSTGLEFDRENDQPIMALEMVQLRVNVVLIDRRTRKKAILYVCEGAFDRCMDPSVLVDPFGCLLQLPRKAYVVHMQAALNSGATDDLLASLGFSIKIGCPREMQKNDFLLLFQESLNWV